MINIVFIHGVNDQVAGYSNWLFKQIIVSFKGYLLKKGFVLKDVNNRLSQFVAKEILWADVTTNLTDRYVALEYNLFGGKKGWWNWITKRVDPLALQIMYYLKDKGDRNTGEMSILKRIDNKFISIAEESKDMVIVAHSLGSVIAFDYIFGFRKYALSSDCMVKAFITLGSPIPLFTSSMGHVDSDLVLPPNIKSWYNIFDKDDGVARRCKPFFQNIPLEDVEVRTGIFPVGAHVKYWSSKQTSSVIAKILTTI